MTAITQAFQIALQHHQAGRLAEAEGCYRQILVAQPNHAGALHLLGVIAFQVGRNAAAVELIRKAIDLNPHDALAYCHLGDVYAKTGALDEALAQYRLALRAKPDCAEAMINLGIALARQGQFQAAVAAVQEAIGLRPDYAEAHNNLGIILVGQGQIDAAVAAFRRAVELKPEAAEMHMNLGNALRDRGQLEESMAAYHQALRLNPNIAEAYNNIGNALKDSGRIEESIAAYRKMLQLKPGDAGAHSNLIYTLHFHPVQKSDVIAQERESWNRKFSAPVKRFSSWPGCDRNPDRQLRIGYVSPDFRDHVVGRNLLPLFRQHDHQDFQVAVYSGTVQTDDTTTEFRRCAELWRETMGVSDDALADMIHADGVDILIDLSQHLAGNRLPVFVRRPASVQVSFAGYPEGTGVEAIRYRISDRWLEGGRGMPNAECRMPKENVSLLDSFWCYDAGGIEVVVNDLPAKKNGYITFGSLNNFCKVNESLLRLWARVLREVPEGRLVILCTTGKHRQRTTELLEAEGIAPRRVEFVEPCPRRAYLELYRRLDLVLDTFPYNGHTTSLDALWMGVPVVSRVGEWPVSRAGLSQLSNLGLPELIGHSEDEYVEIAARLARNEQMLAELRQTLRGRMEASVLMDAARFTRNIESAYRAMWRHWCSGEAT